MYKKQFFQVLGYVLALPFFGSIFLGVVKGLELGSYWIGLKVFLFCFLFIAPIFIWVYRAPLKSFAKSNRL
ncbi:hypothetical protein D0B88_16480 [Cellvibrio sp. KY-YJ-3]|nr:hypothetical protein D0B88_16480 [Cellvibrio sp. KY-YJ-3]